ncbi:MAG: hypothetical protein JNM18_08915 [Planctomycetaceae bacterium]|nr:hypothetical protein [Planctomycetaceae bacterium]
MNSATTARSNTGASLKWRPAYVPQLAKGAPSHDQLSDEPATNAVQPVQFTAEPTPAPPRVSAEPATQPTVAPPKLQWSSKGQPLPTQPAVAAKVPEPANKAPGLNDNPQNVDPAPESFERRLFGFDRPPGETPNDNRRRPDEPRGRGYRSTDSQTADTDQCGPGGRCRDLNVPTVDCEDEHITFRGICALTPRVVPEPGSFPCEVQLVGHFEPRCWDDTLYTWKASNLCSKPLYFEEPRVERYGHSLAPGIQPLFSAAHFFTSAAILPYKMGMQLPNECVYSLGYYRPGNCIPMHIPSFPISARGAVFQAGFVSGLFLVH